MYKKSCLTKDYLKIKHDIKSRLKEFSSLWKNAHEKDLFAELCFCLCTPQSKARLAHKAIKKLKTTEILYKGSPEQIKIHLKGVRFHNNKSNYIHKARQMFKTKDNFNFALRKTINTKDIKGTRDWFVRNVKGLGYKEASHFLRNIGFGDNIAILDRHILKNLKNLGVINSIPASIPKIQYFE
ncbi:DNA lyase, partial [bacterium]